MRHKTILHKIVKNCKKPDSTYEFESALFNELCLAGFFDNCSMLAKSVVTSGSTVNLTESAVRRRQQLGLPPLSCSDPGEIKKLIKNTSANKRLEQKQ
jgi:hypothetical protein